MYQGMAYLCMFHGHLNIICTLIFAINADCISIDGVVEFFYILAGFFSNYSITW